MEGYSFTGPVSYPASSGKAPWTLLQEHHPDAMTFEPVVRRTSNRSIAMQQRERNRSTKNANAITALLQERRLKMVWR